MNFPAATPEYEELKTLSGSWGIAYGPVESRRLGTSLGINLLGHQEKICSFDCVYCDLGLTKIKMSQIKKNLEFPTLEQIDSEVRNQIVGLTKKDIKISSLTLSGNGEPTLYPDFLEAVQIVKKIKDDLIPKAQVAVLSNGAHLDNAKVLKGMNLLDARIIKLDAGNEDLFHKINAPLVRLTLAKLIQGARKLKDVTIQSLFVQGKFDNTTKPDLDEWLEVVGIIKPKQVQLLTLDRVPPTSGLKPVPPQRLKEISETLYRRTHIKALVFA